MERIGQYGIGGLLGEGGAGRVYAATRDDGRRVALKVLETGSPRREARIAGLLRHRHLVDVYLEHHQLWCPSPSGVD